MALGMNLTMNSVDKTGKYELSGISVLKIL